MKKKIVLWGNDADDKKILIALELKERESKVDVHTFAEGIVTEAFYNEMMDNWRASKEVAFPEGHVTQIRELSMTDDILPETIKVQRGDLINRAKAEWHFVVLSTKLYDLYSSELEDLKEKAGKLVDFDNGLWEEVKSFWAKLSEQARERNLFRDHADKLRDDTNALFTSLKEMKAVANAKLAGVSKEHMAKLITRLDTVKEKVEKGLSLGPLFEELKKIQVDFKNADLTRNDRSKAWKKIDEAFKIVKEKKYGKASGNQSGGASSRLEKRFQGLLSAIGKMESSINRDKGDINFQNKRADQTHGQLEMQIRQAKVKMIEDRIASKQEKLDEMLSTKAELEKRIQKEKVREEKQAEKKEIQKKKEALKAEIDAKVHSKAEALSDEEAEKLKKAAAIMNKPKKAAKKQAPKAADAADPTPEKSGDGAKVAAVAGAAVAGAAASLVGKTTQAAEKVATEATAVVEEVKEEIKEAGKEAGKADIATAVDENINSTVEKAKETLAVSEEAIATNTEEVKSVVSEVKETTTDAAVDVKETVVDKVDAAKEAVADKVEESTESEAAKKSGMGDMLAKGGMVGAAMAFGAKMVDTVSDKIEGVADSVGMGDTLDNAKEMLGNAKDTVKENIGDAKDLVSEKIGDAKEAISSDKAPASEAGDTGIADKAKESSMGENLAKGGLLGAAVAFGAKMVDTVSDKIEDVADSVGMGETLDNAKERLTEIKDTVTEKAGDLKDKATSMAADAKDGADATVDEVAARVKAEEEE